jgi:hypothetical protein
LVDVRAYFVYLPDGRFYVCGLEVYHVAVRQQLADQLARGYAEVRRFVLGGFFLFFRQEHLYFFVPYASRFAQNSFPFLAALLGCRGGAAALFFLPRRPAVFGGGTGWRGGRL